MCESVGFSWQWYAVTCDVVLLPSSCRVQVKDGGSTNGGPTLPCVGYGFLTLGTARQGDDN